MEPAAIGGFGMGVVVGWLVPIVRKVRWQPALASALTVAVVLGVLFGLTGPWGSIGGLVGIVTGAWLHGAFLEHVAARASQTEEV